MSYEEMSLKSFIDEMKEVSDGFHPRKFCFVLGAGASRSSGIKSGQELVKIWDKELRERNEAAYQQWRREMSITDENMSSFYSQYYEKRFRRCPTDGYNYIEKIMEQLIKVDGNNARYHRRLAEILFYMPDKAEYSLAEYRKTMELDPENDMDHFSSALLLRKMGQYEEALEEFYKASAIGPR